MRKPETITRTSNKMTILSSTLFFIVVSLIPLASGQGGVCHSFTKCGDCIKGGGDCIWCADEDFSTLFPSRPRCYKRGESAVHCKSPSDPKSEQSIPSTGNKPVGPDVQVNPQIIDLKLRPGQAANFEVAVRPAENYPADLYFLMDLSGSMNDDLRNFQNLDIAAKLKKVTTRYQLGFGSFVDKTRSPFVDLVALKSCRIEPTCRMTYAFHNALKLTPNETEFKIGVGKQKVSSNYDLPENSFDGLMQLAVCQKAIGWRPIDTSRRLVVLLTDAPYHQAGDGKIGGIVTPNDGKCHLDKDNYYTMTNELDYPSVSFLKKKLKESKIVPILAVTANQKTAYEALAEQWKELGATSGVLATDSSNIVDLVATAYNKVMSTVRLIDDAPSSIKVKYETVNCKDGSGNECKSVGVKDIAKFKVSVTATSDACSNPKKSFRIGIAGFGDIQVRTSFVCSCACEEKSQTVPNSPRCNSQGTRTCGACYCNPGRFGTTCKCDSADVTDLSLCRPMNDTNSPVCSGKGTCICGQCICHQPSDPAQVISGQYCECNNFNCLRHQGKICGGPDHGKCVCGKCECTGVWTGSNCGVKNCALVEKNCLIDGKICSGHGTCECGVCSCNDTYTGEKCENCPGCKGVCETSADCLLCQLNILKDQDRCRNCSLTIRLVNNTLSGQTCIARDQNGCLYTFSYLDGNQGNRTFLFSTEKTCPSNLVSKPNILAIVLGTIGGILLAGLILLLLWKLLISAYDRYEYSRFEKETMKAKWERTENPLYIPSKQKFDNPMYAGTSQPN